MRQFNYCKNSFKQLIVGFAILLLLLAVNNAIAQTKGEKATVSKSATVDFKTIEKYSKEHPTDPNERRIAGTKNGANEGREEGEEEEEEELPILKSIPKGARVVTDPFGKMPAPQAGKPSPGTNNQTSFAPITNFNAIDDVGSTIPPDVGGQIGPNHVMTTLNGTGVRIQNRAGGVISTVTLNAFFASVGAPNTFDPKVMYDPYNGRWIVVACGNAQSASSAVLVGVSATNDPTGTWKLYSLDADAANVNWFDYPSIGFTKDWVVITGNMFTVAANGFSTGRLYAYKKSDLYAAVASPAVTSINGPGAMCPAITYDNSISTMYVLVTGNGNSGGNGFIGVSTLTGAVGSEVLSATTFISTPNPWANGAAANFAPQSGTANKVACNDTRMQKVIYRNGSIWGTHTIFLPAAGATRSSVQWWQLSTASAVLQRGRIDDATGANFYAFPSIDVNKNNDAMIGCSKFSGTTFPSACYALRMASDSVNTFQADFVYKAGLANYFKTFSGTTNRWGDYTSVCVDPVDDMNFWTVQEYARAGNLWGTWWAGVCTPPPTPGAIFAPNLPYYANSTGNVFSVTPVSGATSYTWTFPAGCTITAGANTNSVTVTLGNTSGNVTVVANKSGCNSNARVGVLPIVAAPVLYDSAFNNGPVCQGGTLSLTSAGYGGIPPYTYSWSGPNSFTSTAQNPTIANIPLANAGTYTVTVTDSRSPAVSVSATTNVVINPAPVISASANPAVICSGGNAQLTVIESPSGNGTPPTYCTASLSTYNACTGAGGSNISNVTIASTTLNSNTVCNFVGGVGPYTNYPALGNTTATLIAGQTYSISVTNINGNGVVSMWIDYNRNGTFESTEFTQVYTNALTGSVNFNVPATATLGVTKMRVRSRNAGFANGAGDACSTFGSGTVEDYTITIANTGYAWSPATFLNATTGSSVAATGVNTTTTYTVTATSALGCVSTATTTLTVNPLPTISATASLDTVCLGFSSLLFAIETSGPQTSLVYAPPGGTDNTLNDHITLVNFVNLNNPSGAGGSSFEDFTNTVPAALVYPGQPYSLTVNVADGGDQEFAAAWFDWNRNGTYEPSEFVNVPLAFSGTYNGTVSVTVPASAIAGVIHMRVRSRYNNSLSAGDAYSSYNYGETEEYLVNVFRPVVRYLWFPGAIAGNPITVSPTTTSTYQVVGTDANGCVSDTASVQVAIRPIPGNPAVYGNNSWIVYAYDSITPPNFAGIYKGYYTDSNLDFYTDLSWNINEAPSNAIGYVGCPVGIDNHSWSAKRRGFPCGYYELDIPGHDDDAELYINGTLVFSHYGCCDNHTNVWTGWLGANDSVEYRVAEGGGQSYGFLTFNLVTPPALLPITGGPNVCVGSTKQLSNASPGTGTWSSSDITKCTINRTTGVITGVATGSAVITYNSIAPNGCAAGSITTTITVLASPTVATITGNRVPCLGTTTQLANATVGGTWASLNPTIATISSTGLVTTVSVGTATITYTTLPNASGCTRTSTTTVSVKAIPTVGAITGNAGICVGSTTPLSISTTGGTWSSSAPGVATVSGTGVVTGVAAGLTTITYTTAANSSGCVSKAVFPFDVIASPTIPNTLTPPAVCSGNPFQYSPTGVGVVNPDFEIVYKAGSTTVLAPTLPVGTFIYGNTNTGLLGQPTTFSNNTTGSSYDFPGWSFNEVMGVVNENSNFVSARNNITFMNGPGFGGGNNEKVMTQVLGQSLQQNTMYVLTADFGSRNDNGTPAVTPVLRLYAGSTLLTPIVSSSPSMVQGDFVTYSRSYKVNDLAISGALKIEFGLGANVAGLQLNTDRIRLNSAPNATFTWTRAAIAGISNPAVTTPQTGNINEVLINTTNSPVNVVYAFAINQYGCSATQNVTVSVRPSPAPIAPITGVPAVCGNNTSQLSTTSTGGTWSSVSPGIATVSNTGLVTPVSAGTTTITYTVSNGSGCSSSASVLFTVSPAPTIAPITGGNSVCVSNSKQLSCATPGGTWSSSDVTKVTVNATTGVITGVAGGTAVITYTVAPVGVGCTISTSVTITVLTTLPTVALTQGNRVVCLGLSSQLTNATAGGTWSSSNPAIASVNSTGLVTGNAVGTCNILYTTAPNSAGCTRTSTVSFAVRALPTVAPITGGNGVCVGGTTQLANATTGGTWSTSDGATATVSNTGLVSGVVPGTVIITYTTPANTNGCVNSTTFTMNVNPASGITGITAANNPVCSNKTTTLTAVGVTGVSPVVTWYSGPGGTGTNFGTGVTLPNAVAGVYYAVVTNACGTASAEASITVTSKPISTSDTTASACNSFTWRGTTYTNSGTYNLILTNSVGCDSIRTLNLTIRKNTLTATITNPLCFNAATGSISVSATGGTAPYLFKNGASGVYSTNSTFTGLRAGSYTIFAQDATGCASSQVFVITQPTAVSATATKVDASCPGAANGSITVNGAGGTGPYTYRYGSTGAFTSVNTFSNLKAGSYRVYVNDSNNCTGYSIVVVVGNALPTCPLSPVFAKATQPIGENAAMRISLSPNPSGNIFNLMVHAPKQDALTIRIFDVNGKIVHTVKGMPEQTIRFGEGFTSGTYMVEVRQGDYMKTVKAIKIR